METTRQRMAARYLEGPLRGRILLFLSEHASGAAVSTLVDALLPHGEHTNALKAELVAMLNDGLLICTFANWPHDSYTPVARDDTSGRWSWSWGYRLAVDQWLKITRATQDVEARAGSC